MKRFLLFVLCGWCSCFPTYADVLVPLDLFADKNQGKASEGIFVWNGDKYLCEAPVTLFFETEKEAKELCGLCPNRKIERTSSKEPIQLYGKGYSSIERKLNRNGHWSSDEGYEDVYACVPRSIRTCPADKPLLDTFGFCHACDDDQNINVSWIMETYEERKKLLSICPNNLYCYEGLELKRKKCLNNLYCPKGLELIGSVTYSFLHDCPERELLEKGGGRGHHDLYSVLVICPPKKPLRDTYGDCHSCDETGDVKIEKEEDNLVCPAREVFTEYYKNRRPEGYAVFSSVLKKCPVGMPLRDQRRGCHACDEGVVMWKWTIPLFLGEK